MSEIKALQITKNSAMEIVQKKIAERKIIAEKRKLEAEKRRKEKEQKDGHLIYKANVEMFLDWFELDSHEYNQLSIAEREVVDTLVYEKARKRMWIFKSIAGVSALGIIGMSILMSQWYFLWSVPYIIGYLLAYFGIDDLDSEVKYWDKIVKNRKNALLYEEKLLNSENKKSEKSGNE